jgi:pentatricopeptide repeat protein
VYLIPLPFPCSIRSSRNHVHHAFDILRNPEHTQNPATVEALNVVMSAYAERGDVDRTLAVLEEFARHGLEPNVDSFSSAMEVLGKELYRRKKNYGQKLVDKNIEAAGAILTMMEEQNVEPSSDVIRNYVELLCLAEEVETATDVVMDVLRSDQSRNVNNKTLYRVAIANADMGNFDVARKLASSTSEYIAVLHRNIDSKEQRFIHVQQMKKRQESLDRQRLESLQNGE